jgi:hypothetical protein
MSLHDKYILDANHKLVSVGLMEWAQWFEQDGNRRVAEDTIDGFYVSTVFLGLDHSFSGTVPLVFETMVFADGNGELFGRYPSWDQALGGHAAAIKWVKEKNAV